MVSDRLLGRGFRYSTRGMYVDLLKLRIYKSDRIFYLLLDLSSLLLHLNSESHMQNDNDIQGMDDSDRPQNSDNIHHIQNLMVYIINSFNTHNLKMRDSGNHNNCGSLSSCRPSVVSATDEARSFVRSTLSFATSGTTWIPSWSTSLAKFYYSHAASGSISPPMLHRAIFVGHSFLLSNRLRHSFAYLAQVNHINYSYWLVNSYSLLLLVSICNYFNSPWVAKMMIGWK